MQQSIDQSAAIALVVGRACSGVDHHSRRLVHHRQVVIFVNNVEGDVLGNRSQRRPLRCAQDGNLLAAAQLQRRLGNRAVDQRLFFAQHLLHPRPADVGNLLSQELVEPLAGSLGGNGDGQGKA